MFRNIKALKHFTRIKEKIARFVCFTALSLLPKFSVLIYIFYGTSASNCIPLQVNNNHLSPAK